MKEGEPVGSPIGVAEPPLQLPFVWEKIPVGWGPNFFGVTPHPQPYRARVPSGWLVASGPGMAFVPDPGWRWDPTPK